MTLAPGHDPLQEAKQALRRVVRARLASETPASLVDAGRRIADQLAPLLPASGTVALFASRAHEVSTAALDNLLRARGLARAVPRIEGDELIFVRVDDEVGVASLPVDRHGIPTPTGHIVAALSACDLVVVPGLAFDRQGGRLGYGRGYYDRALAGVDDRLVVGVLHDCQWVDTVPCAAWDRHLPVLVSPAGVVRCHG